MMRMRLTTRLATVILLTISVLGRRLDSLCHLACLFCGRDHLGLGLAMLISPHAPCFIGFHDASEAYTFSTGHQRRRNRLDSRWPAARIEKTRNA